MILNWFIYDWYFLFFMTWSNNDDISQRYYLDEWLDCAPNQMKFDTYVNDTYSFAYLK